MKLNKVSVSVSLAYVLAVAVVTTIASLVSPAAGQLGAWLLTLPAGAPVLGFLYFLVLPLLAATGFAGDGPLGLAVMISGYVLAAVANVVLVLGVITLWRQFGGGSKAGSSSSGS